MAIRSARGTKDILPGETPHWRFLEDLARDLAEDYGYREIRTPVFESADLFVQGMGATAGLVERELWTFHDKHGRKLALRADGTAPIVRAFHEHGLGRPEDGPTKLWYLGPVFLHGRDREVESRQGHQFGFEALGSLDAALDAEVLVMVTDFCAAAGLADVKVSLNSLGCKKCRPAYHQGLKDYFGGRQDELCKTCKRRYKSHPLWTLGCPEDTCFDLARVAPSIYGFLCTDCRSHFNALKTYLTELKVQYQLNPLVVRDLEYYDRTIFEVSAAGRPVAFGGRYDELSAVLGGPPTPGVGCSIDMEPLLQAMHDAGLDMPAPEPPRVVLAGQGEEAVALLLPVLYALRRAGIQAELAYPTSPGESAAEAARRSQAQLTVLLEEEDARRRIVTLTDADRGRSQEVRLEEAVSRIGRELGVDGLKDTLRPVEVRRLSITRRRRPIRGRSRAMYGTDVPGPTRRSSARDEEPRDEEGGRRRRRRRSRREEEAAERDTARRSSRDEGRTSSRREEGEGRRRRTRGDERTRDDRGRDDRNRDDRSRDDRGRDDRSRDDRGRDDRGRDDRGRDDRGRDDRSRDDRGRDDRGRGDERSTRVRDDDSLEREAARSEDQNGTEREGGRRRRRRSRRRGGERGERTADTISADRAMEEAYEPRGDDEPRSDDEGGESRERRSRRRRRSRGGRAEGDEAAAPAAEAEAEAEAAPARSEEPAGAEPEARPRRRRTTRRSEEAAEAAPAEAPPAEEPAPRRRAPARRRRATAEGGDGEAVAAQTGGDE